MHQQLTPSLARTENPLEVLETLEMFRNVQPQLQPHLAQAIHAAFEHQSRPGTSSSSEEFA
jgi:hypothetical protein